MPHMCAFGAPMATVGACVVGGGPTAMLMWVKFCATWLVANLSESDSSSFGPLDIPDKLLKNGYAGALQVAQGPFWALHG